MGCGEDVDTNLVERNGKTELTCIFCGFTLDFVDSQPSPPARCIATVDDAEMTRTLVMTFLQDKGLAQEVLAFANGREFVSAVSHRLSAGKPLDCAILDIEMPVMDGFTAARLLRAMEQAQQQHPCPIIFFSARKADEGLRKQMSLFRPARYLNKGAEGDVQDLMRRVGILVSHLGTYFEQ
jgi:CheY-like chemotaxis protein